MIDFQTFCQIRLLCDERKLSVPQIAAELQLDSKTVAKWVKRSSFVPAARRSRSSMLDSFKSQIQAWLERHDYTAQQILQRLREAGYKGGYGIVRRYVRKVRPATARAFLTLQFAPGECLQVDWGSFGWIQVGEHRRRLSFFAGVLSFSRMLYLEFTLSQSQEHFLAAHQRAFSFFGGVPHKIMVDNCKTAVLSHPLGQAAQFNPRYLDFAAHYGFQIRACGVRQPQEKGRVENAVGYIKKNFLHGLELPPWPALHDAARAWLNTVANVRIHGQTHKTPLELFSQEKAALHPLGVRPYDLATIHDLRANRFFRVTFDSNRYSVPARLAGARLTLKVCPEKLIFIHDQQVVAEHPRSYERHRDFEHPDHARELRSQRLQAREQILLHRFLTLCPQAQEYLTQLQSKRLDYRRHIQKIVALTEIYGNEKVARALLDTMALDAFSAEYITNLLEQRARPVSEPGALHLTRSSDLLDIVLPEADLTIYQKDQPNKNNPS
jgi:transposase